MHLLSCIPIRFRRTLHDVSQTKVVVRHGVARLRLQPLRLLLLELVRLLVIRLDLRGVGGIVRRLFGAPALVFVFIIN